MYIVGEGLIDRGEFLSELEKILPEFGVKTNNKKISYYNVPAGFDIEVTSFYENGEKRAVMYHWQFGICNLVTTGRTWEEYIDFITEVKSIMSLSDQLRLLVYVHNLPYEFQFMRKRFDWEEVFLLDDRKPVYANNHGIEYRCSLKLAGGKSLEKVGEDLQNYPVRKAKGDLDYSVMRSPLTPLTEKELYYCEMDIRVLLSYIQEKIEQDGDVTKIPLTNTGYVRNYCRKECFRKWRPYHNLMSALTLETDEYSQLKRAFQGGFVHANAHHARKVLKNVHSQDFTSSYPGVMVLEKFPMSKSVLLEDGIPEEKLEQLFLTKCCLFDMDLWGVVPKLHQEHPISTSKCWQKEGWTEDNGRIVTASHIKTTITEQDYFTYNEFYDWDYCEISNLRVYEKAYLPKPFIMSILELYKRKTKLKGDDSEIINYMISKNMLNAAYGMSVTDIVRDEYKYVEGSIVNGKMTDFPKQPKNISEKIDKYNDGKRRFLFYPWGVWVTAYARANLFSGILELGDDYCYSDTDSLKYLNHSKHKEYFERYDAQIKEKIERSAKHNKIPVEMYSPKTLKNKIKDIGVWDDEGEYDKFKTLGAKRYLTYKKKKGYVLTLAGANKEKAMEHLISTGDPFSNFDDKLIIPKESSGRLILTYIDKPTKGIIVDCNGVPYSYEELSSIHMENSEYRLSMGKYAEYLKGYENTEYFIQYAEGLEDISE